MPKPVLDLIVAAIAIQSVSFSPPLDRDFAYVTEQVQRDAQGTRTFRAHRTLRFGRDEAGLHADLRLDKVDGDARAGGTRFEAGMSGLIGRTVRYRLGSDGSVVSIEGMDGHWSDFVDALASNAGRANAQGQAIGDRVIAPLRSAPSPQRRAMFASMIAPAIAADIAAGGARPLGVASEVGRPPFGSGAMLSGTERVDDMGDGTLRLTRTVTGTHGSPAIAGTSPVERVNRERQTTQLIDRKSGLMRHSEARTVTLIGDAELLTITRITIGEKTTGN